MPERDARSCFDRLEESLRFVERALLNVPPNAELGPFLVTAGELHAKPTLAEPLRLGELFSRYQAEHPAGVEETTTRSTEVIHISHLLRLIGPKAAVSAITTATLQGYKIARAAEKGLLDDLVTVGLGPSPEGSRGDPQPEVKERPHYD
jgi:hypothetical protein